MSALLRKICSELVWKAESPTARSAAKLQQKRESLPKNLRLQQVTCPLCVMRHKLLRPGVHTKARRVLFDADLIKSEQLFRGSIHTLV